MDKKVPLYNPLEEDFTRIWFNDNNKPQWLKMEAGKVTFFTYPQARFMTKHLADRILSVREINPLLEQEREKIIKEIRDIDL